MFLVYKSVIYHPKIFIFQGFLTDSFIFRYLKRITYWRVLSVKRTTNDNEVQKNKRQTNLDSSNEWTIQEAAVSVETFESFMTLWQICFIDQ